MKVKFWGVRGSIAVPGESTLKYGGNTTCIEVRTDDNDLIILDAGTGIFPLSHTLLANMPVEANIFISHTHWDHIQGLPFYIPIFVPGNTLKIHGAFDPISQQDIRRVISQQLEHCYFPVREPELSASLEYITLREFQSVKIGENTTVTNIFMNHPVLNFGYRIDCNGKSLFFTGDHEEWFNIYEPGEPGFEDYQVHMEARNKQMVDFIRNVDVLVMDTSYTIDEYPAKAGWGHGTYDSSIRTGREAGAKKLFFTHHEPTRTDALLEKVYNEALKRNPPQPGDPEFLLAREGLEYEW
ncbi:MAG: MBL fold metallo-hydrolase [Magnetococcales bacterium]|nr:MBL fold metallo-hydrolase [Magnetococcales bacterium]